MDDVLPVIRLLRSFDVERLEALVTRRRVPARASSGIVDVAEWLVDPANVRDALERSGWRACTRLRAGDPAALESAQALALAAPTTGGPALLPVAVRAVDEVLARATPVAGAPTAASPDDEGRDARGAQRAHALTALVADLLVDFDRNARAARDGRGGPRLAGAEVRRIATAIELDPELIEAVSSAMHLAGLAGSADDAWAPTELGRVLERGSRIDRWRAIVESWLDVLSVDGRDAVLAAAPLAGGNGDADVKADEHRDAVDAAVHLGLLVDGALTTAGRLVLDDRVDEAARRLEPHLPDEVDGVYVQPDLTIIAPGPLSPEREARLRSVADLERRGTASIYRLSAASVARAFADGASENDVLETLSDLSIVPIPQPVSYLIAEAASRHGLVRVRASGTGARILSHDPQVLDGLAVDQSLGALRLRRRPDGSLDTLLAPAHALAALVEAKVPATLEDADGDPVPPPAPRTAPPPSPSIAAAARRLALSLHEEAQRQGDGDEVNAWVQQRLERARRAKSPVRMRVRVDGEAPTELVAVPVSMTGRWLRVTDPVADVERTFPIAAVELLDDEDDAAGGESA